MSDQDQLLASLNAGRGELLGAVEGLTDEQAAVKPAGGGWSALECVEHVAAAETLLLRRLKTQSVVVPEELSRDREAALYARLASRGKKVEAPEFVRPTGRFATLGEAVGAFLDARERTVEWLKKCDFDLRLRAVEHPLLGQASAYEFILIMAAHPARHARQILEGRGLQPQYSPRILSSGS
jgi:DinB superfamily